MNCKQPIEKRLGAYASKIVDSTKSVENAVSLVCRIKIKVWDTVVASGAMNLENYKEWLNAIESEPKSTRVSSSDLAVVLKNICKKGTRLTSTR